jgi:hypothetical protein
MNANRHREDKKEVAAPAADGEALPRLSKWLHFFLSCTQSAQLTSPDLIANDRIRRARRTNSSKCGAPTGCEMRQYPNPIIIEPYAQRIGL